MQASLDQAFSLQQRVNRAYEFADLSEYSLKDRLLIRAADLVFYLLINLIGLTARFEVIGWENHEKAEQNGGLPIYVFWHDRIFLTTYWWRKRRIVVMTSRSFDGEYIARFIQRFGYGAVRGSSTRGGVGAIVEMARLMRAGCTTAFTIDGPKGPRYVAKMGAVLLAKKSGHPIVPVTMALARYWRTPSWDAFQIPKPFTRARVYVAPPIYVPADADEVALAAKRDELQQALDHLNRLSTDYAEKNLRNLWTKGIKLMKSFFAIVLGLAFLGVASAQAQLKPPTESAMDRFLRYVKIDTQSQEDQTTVPSTRKQLNLANLLAKELTALGAQNVRVSEFGIVYATVPGNLPDNSKVPVIGFIAHMDTSPAVSGENVNAIIHKNYQGGDIVLPKDPTQKITVEKNPELKQLIGDDIITADGTTLLGSDDKAGIAEIMTMIDTFRQNPQLKRGTIVIAFTPDEEVGAGIEKFDIKGFGAKFAYTVDGGPLGEISDETWSARTATITFQGKSTHPGYAKGIMINAMYAIADYLGRFPKDMLPETTEGRVGFVHPYAGVIDVESSNLKVLLRDFDVSGLDAREKMLRDMVAQTAAKFPEVKISIDVKENYKNMKEVLKDHPELVNNAMEAARRAGITPFMKPIRGGTDGARLTFQGLPTPNIFTGGSNFHGKLEFNSRRGLEKSTEMLVHLVQVFAEKS